MHKKIRQSLIVTAAFCAAVIFWFLRKSEDPTGGDGYFYLKQIKILAETYSFYHADYSLYFLISLPIRLLTKSDLLTYQLMSLLSYGLILYFLAKNYLGFRWWAIMVAVLLAIQYSVLKTSFEFCKQGLALAFFLWGAHYWTSQKLKRLSIFWILSFLTHKIFILYTLPLFVLLTIQKFYVYFRRRENEITFKKRKFFVLIFGLATACLAAFVLFLKLAPTGKALAVHLKVFLKTFQFESWTTLVAGSIITTPLQVATILVFLICAFMLRKNIRDLFIKYLIVLVAIPLAPVFGGANLEIKFRLLLISHILILYLLPYLWLAFEETSLARNILLKKLKPVSLFAILLLFSLNPTLDHNEIKEFPWISAYSDNVRNIHQIENYVRPNEELVTHHGLQFYIDYKTKIRARSLVSPSRPPQFQVAFVPEFFRMNPEMADEIEKVQLLKLGEHYALFDYQEFEELKQEFPLLKHWRNTIRLRPDFVPDYPVNK